MSRKKPNISGPIMAEALEIAAADLRATAERGTFAAPISEALGVIAGDLVEKRSRLIYREGRDGREDNASDGPSERGLKFAEWFRSTLPEGALMEAGWQDAWARCFDDMLRIDGRTAEQIWNVCKWARAEKWWRANFLSPRKLRKRDKDQVLFFDRFVAEMETERAVEEAKPRRESAMVLAVRPVFEEFEKGTGISMRLPTDLQIAQAGLFLANFQLWELRVTLAWLKVQITRAEGGEKGLGFTRLSAQWQSLFGKEPGALGNFEQRLGLAVAWAGKARPDLLAGTSNAQRSTPNVQRNAPVSAEEQARLAEQARKLAEGFGIRTEGGSR